MISPAAAASINETSSSSFIVPNQTCQRLTLAEIEAATNNFDETLVIGRGGFGNVYKSITKLGSANEVAIKRLQATSSQGATEFEAEVKLLSKLHHGNLVPLIGYCCEGKEMVLAYEFMPNGTLEDHLHRGVTNLSWLQRLKICIGVARALDYLHIGTSTQHGVIHRDVKTSNILLDSNFAAKVSDFGLAKLGTINQTRTHVSTLVKGTHGYMDPCYFYSGQLTRKSDVYAFGVVLLEVVTGKKAVDPTLDEDQWSLAVWAQDHIKQGRLNAIIDHRLTGQISKKCLKEFASIAVNCLHDQPKRRPTMAEIVVKLESILSRERGSVGSGVNDRRIFNRILYLFSGKDVLMQAHSEQEDKPNTELLEGPQPVQGPVSFDGTPPTESPQPVKEVGSTAENQVAEEPQSVRFTWTIENFSHQANKKIYSDVFVVGGYKWCVLIYPKGNNVDHLSVYLDVADSSSLPYGWSRYAQFTLAVVNQIHNKFTIKKDTQHQFSAKESDWGFTSFMALSELHDPSRGYLINDTCIIEADVAVKKVIDDRKYDSKKETGYVGLKNQGATGYINILLQTWYHIPYFRKAIYHMPTENDMPSRSIPLALQSIFYKLQYNETRVATKELTKSFGWDQYDSFMQHDVQELNKVLCEKLEDKMKGTFAAGTIQRLFEGHHINYTECVNVDFKSTRKESFHVLQLEVKGCRDVYASFDKYVEVERLEGNNKYHAEGHGLQDAKKGVLFSDFPPVLQLWLKRFEYDFTRDTMVKINDRYEFPLELDLDREDGKYLMPDADKRVRNLYTLHSVLVHSGDTHGGHYYSFIRPTLSEQWFKFDDEIVTKEDMKRALEEQYGGEEELPQTKPGYNNAPVKFTKHSNAYILVYIREGDKDKLICDVNEKDIAEHLRIRLKKEQEEKEDKRRYKTQSHLYTIIKVARDADLLEQIGKDIYFDLVDHDKVHSFRILKQMPFNQFKEEVGKQFGVPVQYQRFWIWTKRQNQTYRPSRPLTALEEIQSVGQLREVSNKNNNSELKLFLEIEIGHDLRPLPPPDKSKENILLFFKLYDPEKEELRYIGRFFVKGFSKPTEIMLKLNERAGFSPDEEIELYEEIKFEPSVMCECLDKRSSFRSNQIEDGDIICFQKLPKADEKYRFPDVPSFLEYVKNRQIVHFRSLDRPKDDDFCLELSKLHTYDDVVEQIARKLNLDDPSKIRLTPHNCYSQQPKPDPIKYRVAEHLIDMLVHYNKVSDILYYEVLDIPLPELQCLKTLKVAFHHSNKEESVILNIRLPKQSTVGDVIDEIKSKVTLSHPDAELRLLEVFYHKIYRIFPRTEKVVNLDDKYWTLRAEEIPEEEKNLGPQERLIHVYHFTKETAQSQNQMQVRNFGEPFFLMIHENETLADVKVRIQRKLEVPDEEFSKWKFAFLSLGRPEYLRDSNIVSSRFQRRDVYGGWEQYLGLEHSDTTPKRSFTEPSHA